MKKIFNILAITVLASSLLISCSKGDYNSGDGQTGYNRFQDKNNTPAVTTGSFTAKINGSDFTANTAFANVDKTLNYIAVSGFRSSTNGFVISVSSLTTGTYSVDALNSILYQPEGGTAVAATSGSIVLSEVTDTKIKGTFTMQVSGLDVTEGKFDVEVKK